MRTSHAIVAVIASICLACASCGSGNQGSDTPSSGPTDSPDSNAQSSDPSNSNSGSQPSSDAEDPGSTDASGDEKYADGGTLTIGVPSDPGNLDPQMTVSGINRNVSHLTYDTLVYQQDDGEFVSGVADSWEIDGNSIVFTLNPDVTCSDGSDVTASLVADNINFIADPDSKSPQLGGVVPEGTEAVADDNAGTVTVTTPTPDAFLLNKMATMFIVCQKGLDDRDLLAQSTLGTGPWVLSEAVPDDHYTYVKHDGYSWGPDGESLDQPGVPDTVVVRVISNPTTMANLFLSGEVNFGHVTGSDQQRLVDAGVPAYQMLSPAGETFFNQAADRPTADIAVRKALVIGTDMEQVGKVATGGSGQPSTGLVTLEPKPCMGDTVSGSLPGYDPDKAKSILDEAGWTMGDDGVRVKDGKKLALTFLYASSGGSSLTAGVELLAQQWKALGAQVDLKAVDGTQLANILLETGDWDAGWIAITVSLPTQLAAFVAPPEPPDGLDWAHIHNETYIANAKEAQGLLGDAACEKWQAAEKALFANFDVIPMFNGVTPNFHQHAEVSMVAGELHGSSLRLLKH